MKILQEIEQLLAKTTRAEKAQVLQWIVRDLGDAFPGIESTPNVCGGEPCIVRTRIPVWEKHLWEVGILAILLIAALIVSSKTFRWE